MFLFCTIATQGPNQNIQNIFLILIQHRSAALPWKHLLCMNAKKGKTFTLLTALCSMSLATSVFTWARFILLPDLKSARYLGFKRIFIKMSCYWDIILSKSMKSGQDLEHSQLLNHIPKFINEEIPVNSVLQCEKDVNWELVAEEYHQLQSNVGSMVSLLIVIAPCVTIALTLVKWKINESTF